MLRAFQGFRACPENRHIKQLGRCKILDTPIVLNNEIKPLEDNNKKNILFNGENQVNNYTEEEIKFSNNIKKDIIKVEEEKIKYRNEINLI